MDVVKAQSIEDRKILMINHREKDICVQDHIILEGFHLQKLNNFLKMIAVTEVLFLTLTAV